MGLISFIQDKYADFVLSKYNPLPEIEYFIFNFQYNPIQAVKEEFHYLSKGFFEKPFTAQDLSKDIKQKTTRFLENLFGDDFSFDFTKKGLVITGKDFMPQPAFARVVN